MTTIVDFLLIWLVSCAAYIVADALARVIQFFSHRRKSNAA